MENNGLTLNKINLQVPTKAGNFFHGVNALPSTNPWLGKSCHNLPPGTVSALPGCNRSWPKTSCQKSLKSKHKIETFMANSENIWLGWTELQHLKQKNVFLTTCYPNRAHISALHHMALLGLFLPPYATASARFEPTSVELHKQGLWRRLYRLGYRAAAFKEKSWVMHLFERPVKNTWLRD